MIYGLYTSASSLSVNMARQDVLSNNLANVNTAGFKPSVLAMAHRDAARIEDGLFSMPSNALLERLGAGAVPLPTVAVLEQAPLERTGRDLDVGLEGEGFLVVRAGPGDEGLRLTRDGRMAVASDGTLVTATDGRPVLNDVGQSIQLDPRRQVRIAQDGTIRQEGQVVARLQVAIAPQAERLARYGAGMLGPRPGEAMDLAPAPARVQQGYIEPSGTNPVHAMMGVTSASRAAQGAARMITYFNELMGAAVNRLGRVS